MSISNRRIRATVAGILAIVLGCAWPGVGTARTYLGSGGTSCADYLQIKQQAPAATQGIELWLLGYVSGVSFMTYAVRKVDLLADQSAANVISFVQGYCAANPSKTLNNAANEYWFQLSSGQRN